MKALVLKGKGKIAYIDKREPELEALHGALLEPILVSPCTSDVHTIWQGSPKRDDLTLGHEVIARVKAAGELVKDFKPGEIVAVSAITPDWGHPDVDENYAHAGQNFSAHMIGKSIDGAFQSLFYLPFADKNLAHIPDGLSLEDALMCVDVVQTGFTAVEEAGVKSGDTVVVMGIGAIGLAAIMGSRMAGAKKIFAVGSRQDNVRLAESMSDEFCSVEVLNYRDLKCSLPAGMHPLANSTGSPVVNYVLGKTGTKGADCVLLCGGNDLSFPQAVDMVKYGTGVVSNVMYYGADIDVQDEEYVNLVNLKQGEANAVIDAIQIPKFSMGRGMAGKTLKFSLSRGGRENLERVMKEVVKHGWHPSAFITKRYMGLDNIENAIYDMKDRKAIKIAVQLAKPEV
ncbi:alcohol dehydrogenase catalytic domain-containing protein [Oribacterium sp. WCC10]|uniref:alcohol dehydrogenase catalytic domain-containing protein n=1 Tax=Oribacterium sp. WCC10 TaxID=1855343 RepID=UPI0008E89BAB|nr:alcohol dehydrogenase catalytic domain-containing protein [Oribacterium sp. WCC10]SFG36440.1 Threonine dehydrogenase [Oribacterium sp. WCC10]